MEWTVIALISVVGLVSVGVGYFIARRSAVAAGNEHSSILLMQQQLDGLREQVRGSLDGVSQQVTALLSHQTDTLNTTSKTINERLDNAARVIGQVNQELGRVASTVQSIGEIKDILKAPKLRGGFGETFLEDLLSQILPREHYIMQHGFGDGRKVDAVIKLGDKLVPVDSKFPLENFQKAVASTSEDERKVARRLFQTDVRKHVDAVAGYIRPDEGTYEFALMYIPAENIYYEVAVKNEWGSEDRPLLQFALERKVITVSPNTLYAYLMTIAMGLKGMQVEKYAQEIIGRLGRAQKEFDRFQTDFAVVGSHLEKARGKYEEAEKRLGRFGDRLATFAPQEEAAELPEPPADQLQ